MARMSIEQRNVKARLLVKAWLATAKADAAHDQKDDFPKERRLLETLIPINIMGFRGIVLTAIVGKALNHAFDPSTDFYACNSRSIFEKGIYYALVENGVPCGKSDPLNVAKNAHIIDQAWARGRKSEAAAMAAVAYIKLIQDQWHDAAYRDTLIHLFFDRLWEFALFCQSKNKPLAAFDGIPPATLANRLARFVLSCPEGGATPQLVVGTLLRELRLNDAGYASVEGVNESVFGTNTTSKKPADVWEVMADGTLGGLYEITAKPIDHKRLDDCVGSLQGQAVDGRVVTFICRLADDIRSLDVVDDTLLHGGLAFQFVDLRAFIVTIFCLLEPAQQAAVITLVDVFVKETNRKGATKDGWAEIFGQQ